MSKCKYYLEKEVVSYDGGITWNETGVTRKGNLYEESSEDCTDPSVQYRWINMDVTTDYICDGTNKYYKQKKQVSYDGIIWQDVTPAEYQRGSIYEVNSPDCQPTYRWVNMDIATDYICDETTYTKYYKQKKQVSYGGQEWQDVIPYEYQRGDVYETQSTDCGYLVLPKFQATYSGGQTYEKECDGSTTLTEGEAKPSGYEYTAMTSAVIGECVTNLDYMAFLWCESLTSVTIPNSVISIGNNAFDGCSSLTGITIPTGVTYIGGGAFGNCDGLTSVGPVGSGASVEIPTGVTSISNSTFEQCDGLTSITIPNSVTSIGDMAFYNCDGSSASISIPDSVTSIGESAFEGSGKFTGITIPNSVTVINFATFNLCSNLVNVTIGNSVTSIGKWAFANCYNLTSFTCLSLVPPALGEDVFHDSNNVVIYVPASSLESYKTASGWSSYSSRIQPIA